MAWINKIKTIVFVAAIAVVTSCSVSYKFNGASIDYSQTKTITIAEFPIRSSYVWGPMGPMFNNQLKDQFANHTRLEQVKRNGDLKIEGVNVRFTNNKNHNEDFEQQFTASQSYETTQSLNAVQEELVTQMVKDLCDQIFNRTVANW